MSSGSKRRRNRIAADKRPDSNQHASSIRLSYTLPLLILGFLLASAGNSSSAFAGVLFGFGILLWMIGALGTVYWLVNRLAGPRAAKWAVGLLILSLIIELIFGGQRDD